MDLRDRVAESYAGKRVLVTGHTGFKGAWLSHWLLHWEAEVIGLGLEPEDDHQLFGKLELEQRLEHRVVDIRERSRVAEVVKETQPDFLFHLAAQPLVSTSYRQGVETYETNVMGTVHVLDALRQLGRPCAAVMISSDKCYENREQCYGYRESDPLGGHDPYSSSKGAAEIAIASWRRSFFDGHSVRLASARAGNVIGGGDWAANRIVPDCVRALMKRDEIVVRAPEAKRPWQHVFEPLGGYLWLGAALKDPNLFGGSRSTFETGFNFGPPVTSNRPVRELVELILRYWPGSWRASDVENWGHEADLLHLNTDKAFTYLGWSASWELEDAVQQTVEWYRADVERPGTVRDLSTEQLKAYLAADRWKKESS